MRLYHLAFLFLVMHAPAYAQYGFGPYGPYGRPPEGAYDLPPCNPYYNRDCGRFRWEGPRAKDMRCRDNPMMPDCPRGRGAPYEGPPGARPFYDDE